MCVSISEFETCGRSYRRCPVDGHARAAASARRQENRVTVRTVAANVRSAAGAAAAHAVAGLPPSLLSNLLVSLEAVEPGISTRLLRSDCGALRRVPGMHNDVFSERRETAGAAARLNHGKTDPLAVTRVQLASALCERELVASGAVLDPGEAAAELGRIDTRLDAIASGVVGAGAPTVPYDQLPQRARDFYRRHSIDEIGGLTAVAQRISDRLFEDVTEQARVAAAPRPRSELVERLAAAQTRPLTVADVLAAAGDRAEIADGVVLVGGPAVLVEGLRLPVDGDARVDDVLGRIPAVDFTQVPDGLNACGLNHAVQSLLVSDSPRAKAVRLAAHRRIIERTFYGDTAMSYAAGPDGGTRLLAGKARAHTAERLASRPHSSRHGADAAAQTTRIEGFELSRHLRRARAAREEFAATRIPAALRAVRAREAPLKRYAGPVPAERREAAARAGFRVRHRDNTIDADYPGARAKLVIDWDAAEPVPAAPPGRALCPEHAQVRAGGAGMVAAANRLVRAGRNPELCDAGTLLAETKLASAFTVFRAIRGERAPKVLTATHPLPPAYRGRESQFIAEVFPPGGAFTTSGYTLARSDGAAGGGPGRVRVRYFTSDAMPVTGGHIIDTAATFRVLGAGVAADGTVEVRAVADQVAAQAAG